MADQVDFDALFQRDMQGDDSWVWDLNLNAVKAPQCETPRIEEAKRQALFEVKGKVQVFFDMHIERLCAILSNRKIRTVVGCVAWFTHPLVIKMLQGKDVSIIVQKEDFLRPDSKEAKKDHNVRLHALYRSLQCKNLNRYRDELAGTPLHMMSYATDYSIDPVRCVGCVSNTRIGQPRMHHKFLVFCEDDMKDPTCKLNEKLDVEEIPWIKPVAVWTGSINITRTSERCRENAVYIQDEEVAKAYWHEWSAVASISEPLNWDMDTPNPEWRIGS